MNHPVDLGGTLRARPAEETLAWVTPLLRRLGITRVANVTGLDSIGIPVSLSVRPLSRNLSVSQGKGITQTLADVSAIMESVEGFHSEHLRDAVTVGTFSEVSAARSDVVSPDTLVRGRLEFMRGIDEFPMEWVDATDASTGTTWLLPRSVVCLDFTCERREHIALSVSSNGLAAGNTKLEAICHGIYEVVERDAHARWELKEADAIAETEIDITTLDGSCLGLVAMFQRAGVNVRIWDATSDVGLPTFVCHIRGSGDARSLSTYGGAGAHRVREIALSRALTEAAQSRLTLITGSRDDCMPQRYATQRVGAGELVDVLPSDGKKPFGTCAALPPCESFDHSVQQVLELLASSGFERVLVVDLTREDLQIPVVHVVIPGMIHRY